MLLSVRAELNELLEGSSECLWCFVGRLLTDRSVWAKAANNAERSLLRVLHSTWKCKVDQLHSNSIQICLDALICRAWSRLWYKPHRGKKNNHFYLINSRCSYDREDIKSTILHGRGGM